MHCGGRTTKWRKGALTRTGDSFQPSHLAFLQAGRESSSASDGRGFFTVEIIPKAVFLVSPCRSAARQLVDTAALASLSDSPNSNPLVGPLKLSTQHQPKTGDEQKQNCQGQPNLLAPRDSHSTAALGLNGTGICKETRSKLQESLVPLFLLHP